MPRNTTLRPQESDAELVQGLAANDHAAFERLMRRYNGRLFRGARAILKDDAEAEDAVQDAYLEAYRHIAEFRGHSQVATWLTRIAINQALMRLRRQNRERGGAVPGDGGANAGAAGVVDRTAESPAAATLRGEIRKVIEGQIDELPPAFRAVFVMRDVEELSVGDTAECLGIPAATVQTRRVRAPDLV